MKLYFKHLYPSFEEWREEPFAPWSFKEATLLSVLSFFESHIIEDETFSLKKELDCEVFMDSGAFAATAMGFELDPYEVAEIHSLIKADLIVPLDKIILEEDDQETIERKIEETIHNTEILLDMKPKNSEIIAPLQGLSRAMIERLFDKYRELGITRFALGGVVFQKDLEAALERIRMTRVITEGYFLHIFGRFLHPELLEPIIQTGADSVDGYGYVISSVKGLYIHQGKYKPVMELTAEEFKQCQCSVCQENDLADLQRADSQAQYLLIEHNIQSLIEVKEQFLRKNKGTPGKEVSKEE
ncbi:hypothetical protein EU523_01900 [Candidatus Heimdallarchaeota archaeon]|nr:MAG: hypothetical protein EU523_01900 [Candidatus Heimdallarchaeota archaeon]